MNAGKHRLKMLVLSVLICVTLRPTFLAADDAPAAKSKAGPAAKNKAAATGAARKATKAPPVRSVPTRAQMAPTKERYKQIQQALATKGYLPAAQATGQWTDASIDALKRFQTDQKLDSTGKINSLSLIALGLGPNHDNQSPRPRVP
jgi:peptidoglycan hydrolase-like protein with peptidoglycan-binding domain